MGIVGWLLGKLGLGSVGNAVEGVASVITQHMKDSEAADELKARLKENADEVYAGIRKAMAGSRNWFVADATVLVLWVVASALALYLIPRYGLATYDWVASYIATGELEDYPVGHHELISLVALTGGYGGLHLAFKLFGGSREMTALQVVDGGGERTCQHVEIPDCKRCRWFRRSGAGPEWHGCLYPPFSSGIKPGYYIVALKARAHETDCGLDARHFERRLTLWVRFLIWLGK